MGSETCSHLSWQTLKTSPMPEVEAIDRPPPYLQGTSKDFLGWARCGECLIYPMSSDSHRQGQRVSLASPFPSGSNINYLAVKRGEGFGAGQRNSKNLEGLFKR